MNISTKVLIVALFLMLLLQAMQTVISFYKFMGWM